jgi:pimeloyl-ACP methyl ester carboxylesterase
MIVSPTGSSLYVEMDGPAGAPTIVFTHGWGMNSTFWRYAKLDLGDRFRLVLWDLPGLGRSRTGDRKSVSLEAFARIWRRSWRPPDGAGQCSWATALAA